MSALAVSANREKEKLIDSRREPVRAYTGKPAAKLVTRLLVAASVALALVAQAAVIRRVGGPVLVERIAAAVLVGLANLRWGIGLGHDRRLRSDLLKRANKTQPRRVRDRTKAVDMVTPLGAAIIAASCS